MMAKKLKMIIHKYPKTYDGTKWIYIEEIKQVEVMAEAKGYAMVRRKGCMPFVVSSKDLLD